MAICRVKNVEFFFFHFFICLLLELVISVLPNLILIIYSFDDVGILDYEICINRCIKLCCLSTNLNSFWSVIASFLSTALPCILGKASIEVKTWL